jgi:hypothetical protein
MPVLGVSNPFRSKWRHRSSATEISDTTPKVVPENSQSTQKNLSSEKSKANSDNKGHSSKKKNTKEPPFNSDSLLCGIGNYIFKEPLGDGKFSKVMLATHYSTGEEVAIKV